MANFWQRLGNDLCMVHVQLHPLGRLQVGEDEDGRTVAVGEINQGVLIDHNLTPVRWCKECHEKLRCLMKRTEKLNKN